MRRIRYKTYGDCEKAKLILDKAHYDVESHCDGCELKVIGKDENKAIDYLFFNVHKPQPKCCC